MEVRQHGNVSLWGNTCTAVSTVRATLGFLIDLHRAAVTGRLTTTRNGVNHVANRNFNFFRSLYLDAGRLLLLWLWSRQVTTTPVVRHHHRLRPSGDLHATREAIISHVCNTVDSKYLGGVMAVTGANNCIPSATINISAKTKSR